MAKDFLFEIGCEELPASSLVAVAEAIETNINKQLQHYGLIYETTRLYFTPRRIAIMVKALQEKQPDRTYEKQGPAESVAFGKDGLPTLAGLGFIKSCNASLDDVVVKDTDKGRYVFCRISTSGVNTEVLLPKVIQNAMQKLPIPKPMRWSDHEFSFLRPVHWLCALYGRQIIPVHLFGKEASNVTFGHRIHAPDPIYLSLAQDYPAKLLQARVIIDFNDRKQKIAEGMRTLTIPGQGHAVENDGLLSEVALLVEWPVVLLGELNKRFLALPKEVLVTSLQAHQKTFAIENNRGELLPYFIIIANLESKDPTAVIKGNQKVVSARLSDAEFFFNQDKKHQLADNFARLEDLLFEESLGSVADKSKRMAKIATVIGAELDVNDDEIKTACHLAKCDLVSEMVFEFPELQGLMGYYYALDEGIDPAIAISLQEQYLPKFSGDKLPATDLGICLSLSDRLDTLVGIMGTNNKPTGDKDPFALRRTALAIIRIMIEKSLNIDLDKLLNKVVKCHKNLCNENVVDDCIQFIEDRLKSFYQEQNIATEILQAVLATKPKNLLDIDKRIKALAKFTQEDIAQSLAAANKRVSNLLKKLPEENVDIKIDKKLLSDAAEQALYDAVQQTEKNIEPFIKAHQYEQALLELSQLNQPLNDFFENVMVMADDEAIKNNRLCLLAHLKALFNQVADIALLS